MPASAVLLALLAPIGPPQSAGEVVRLLRAGDHLPAQLNAQIKTARRSGTGDHPPDNVRQKYENTLLLDEPKVLSVTAVEVNTDPNFLLTDEVAGWNGDYWFELGRRPPELPWILVVVKSALPPDAGQMRNNFWQLFSVQNRPLAELMGDAGFETTVQPLPLVGCVVEGRRRAAGKGLQSYRAEVRVTADYAYIAAATCVWSEPDFRSEWEVVNRVREEAVPLPESTRETSRMSRPTGAETWLTETDYDLRLSVGEADRAKFRLPHYGLPEPEDDFKGPLPLPPPRTGRWAYTWIILLPLAGVLLVLIGRRLRRRKPAAAPPA